MSATLTTGVTTVAVLFPGVLSGVVLVPTAVFVTFPVVAVTVAFTTRVKVAPEASVVAVAAALAPATVAVPLPPVLLALISDRPALITSVKVTFCATLGPRFTSVTV
ncbi:hypothetical protein D9M73_236680 [compost metagenome]